MKRAGAILTGLAFLPLLSTPAAAKDKKPILPRIVKHVFLPTEADLIKYQPKVYEGRYLRVYDRFGEAMDPKLLGKAAVKKGYDPADYYIFKTSHQTSEMRCYVRHGDKRDIDIAKNLVKDEPIMLFGELAWVESKRIGPVLHFIVGRVDRGHEYKPVVTLELSRPKYPSKLYRIWEPKEYPIVYPPAKTPAEKAANTYLMNVAFQTSVEKKADGKAGDPKRYVPVQSEKIPYQPKQYVNMSLMVKDAFEEIVPKDKFPGESKRLGYKPDTHLLFRTLTTGKGSDLYCYLSRDETFYVDIVEALIKNVRITIYGTFVAYNDKSLLRMKHFEVDRVDIGWEAKPVIEIRFGTKSIPPKKGVRFRKPGDHILGFPPWKKTYDLSLKCIY